MVRLGYSRTILETTTRHAPPGSSPGPMGSTPLITMKQDNPATQATIMLSASLVCAVVAIWHPWAAFIGAAFAALTRREYSHLALPAVVINGIGLVVGATIWLIRLL